jgi:hypothetical protein
MPTAPALEPLTYPLVIVPFVPMMLWTEEVYDGLGRNLTLGATLAKSAERVPFGPPVAEADVADGLGLVGLM